MIYIKLASIRFVLIDCKKASFFGGVGQQLAAPAALSGEQKVAALPAAAKSVSQEMAAPAALSGDQKVTSLQTAVKML